MNAAAHALSRSYSLTNFWLGFYSRINVAVGLLLMIVLINAVTVIYVKDLNRRNIGELAGLRQATQQMQVQWGQLLLARSTLAAPTRVQRIASHHLGMYFPTTSHVVLLSE